MIQSLFIITSTGETIIEKHWRGTTNRTICDYFVEEVNRHKLREDVPPIISTANHYLISAFREELFVLAVITNEISPLFVIEFLHRVVAVFKEYFGKFEESVIKDNFSTVYQLLEEMLDNGYPLTTEPNALKAMVAPPPGAVGRLAAMGRSGVSDSLPDGALSNIPWRKAGVKYSQNEIYFDVIEEIDAIVDANGEMLQCEVHGAIHGNCRLSGVPDLTMVFRDPSVIDDCSFHPCVRYARYEHDRTLKWTVKWSKKVLSPTCHGTIVLHANASIPDEKPVVLLHFGVPLSSVSGLLVESLVLSNEKYKPYKGVRTLTKTGRFQIRT
ncbi:hypothetical protein DYB30_010943 [Aphanomyces astaci]|uniref:MHD domain-containing protein n=1 Tax=Aphanomyces astaci TaxID=112090 RepID=A0A397CGL5_APHAT|nr:hypothetical protein DYB30_010943 [Aphanomyces astaci]